MSEDSYYADRNIIALDREGGHYARHVMAMTDEQLHSKSDIAAELAYRDSIIQKHKDRIREIEAENERLTLI